MNSGFTEDDNKGMQENDYEEQVSSEAEQLLVQRLSEEQAQVSLPEEAAVKALPPRWEIRIHAERDPIAEETKAYRAIAEEIDGRYDK